MKQQKKDFKDNFILCSAISRQRAAVRGPAALRLPAPRDDRRSSGRDEGALEAATVRFWHVAAIHRANVIPAQSRLLYFLWRDHWKLQL